MRFESPKKLFPAILPMVLLDNQGTVERLSQGAALAPDAKRAQAPPTTRRDSPETWSFAPAGSRPAEILDTIPLHHDVPLLPRAKGYPNFDPGVAEHHGRQRY